jgi:hypothetical protein
MAMKSEAVPLATTSWKTDPISSVLTHIVLCQAMRIDRIAHVPHRDITSADTRGTLTPPRGQGYEGRRGKAPCASIFEEFKVGAVGLAFLVFPRRSISDAEYGGGKIDVVCRSLELKGPSPATFCASQPPVAYSFYFILLSV